MKQTCAVFAALLLLAAAAPVEAQFTYTQNGTAATITGYTGPGGAVDIPDTINGLAVTGIGYAAFFGDTNMTSVTIPFEVTNIGNFAFENCSILTSVTVPEDVASIGDFSFYGCESLTNFTIPAALDSLGQDPLGACSSLTAIGVDPGNSNYTSVDGVLFTEGPATLLQYPGGRAGNYTVPPDVTNITSSAFDGCTGLTGLVVPASVTGVGNKAFEGCTSLGSLFFLGNAPTFGLDLFDSANNATVYYLPGTTGWNSATNGFSSVLWNPLIQASGTNFGVQNNQFGFYITGSTNIPILVEATTNLLNPVWIPLATNTLSNGVFFFSEPFQPGIQSRFYRVGAP